MVRIPAQPNPYIFCYKGTFNLEHCLLNWTQNWNHLLPIDMNTLNELIDIMDGIKECSGFTKDDNFSFYFEYLHTLDRYFNISIITMLYMCFCPTCTCIMLQCLHYFV